MPSAASLRAALRAVLPAGPGAAPCTVLSVGPEPVAQDPAPRQAPGAGGPAGARTPPGPPRWSGRAGPDADLTRVEALVELARRGDGEAFAQLYDRHVGSVYRYLYARTGSHALAEDLTSDTFLRALRGIGGFVWEGRDIGAWFLTIARNLVTDHYRSGTFRLEVATADMLDADRADDGIEDAVVTQLQHVALVDAVRLLKPEQQECLTLRFLHDLSIAETAQVMGRSEGAVKQLQLRALRALARTLPEAVR